MIKHFCDRCGLETTNNYSAGHIKFNTPSENERTASVLLCPSCFSDFFSFLRNTLFDKKPKEKDSSTREIFFNGMHFKAVREQQSDNCSGCFFVNRELCVKFLESTGINCGKEKVIFQRIEP
jgi:hypothetical protein